MTEEIVCELDYIAKEIEKHIPDQSLPGLLSGTAGIALFLFIYSKYKQSEYFYNIAYQTLEKTIDNINLCTGHSFCSGISGICWAIDFLCDNGYIDKQNSNINIELYPYLKKQAIKSAVEGDFDFMHGSIGSAIYLLENNDSDTTFHNEIIESLSKYMIFCADGGCWKYYWADMKKDSRINISISHGMASTCIYLIQLLNKFGSEEKGAYLLGKSIDYIIGQEYKDNRLSIFPTFCKHYDNKNNIRNSRLGWCYGDLGIALLFWNYYKHLGSKYFLNKSIELFLKIGKRKDLDTNCVFDAGLCHGTSGISLIYQKMYLNTNIEEFKEISVYWLNETMNFSFTQKRHSAYPSNNPEHHLSLLDGLSGVGLYLLSQIDKRYLGWEKALLIN